jgi:hypothetical protein
MSSPQSDKAQTQNTDRGIPNLLAGDTLDYLVLVGLTWVTWRISRMGYFEAGDDVG